MNLVSARSSLVLLILAAGALSAQDRTLRLRLQSAESLAHKSLHYTNGYSRTISGATLAYHSSHPGATHALIARSRSDMRRIEWETDTVWRAPSDGFQRFIWIAGIDRGGFGLDRPLRTFTLSVDGEPWFSFQNRKDSAALRWKQENRNGAALTFEAELTDRYGDLFGKMVLAVPAALCPFGRSLRISIDGEDAEVPDWYMTMQYAFNFSPGVRIEPVLLREAGGSRQLLRIGVDNLEEGRMLVVDVDGKATTHLLQLGANTILRPILPVATPARLNIQVDQSTPAHPYTRPLPLITKSSERSIPIFPSLPRIIYLLPYSHNDIGYSDHQTVVEQKQWSYLEQALDLIEGTKNYPEGSRFKWNVEILWPLESYLRTASDEKQRRLLSAIRDGDVGLNAFYTGVLTGLAQPVQMDRYFDESRRLRNEHGLRIETAVITDIPGHTWGVVTALANAGVKYFAIAPNAYDRIGYAYELWGDKPFRWESQSGKESVLAWMAGSSYSAFHEGTLAKLGDEKMFALLRGFDSRSVTHRILHLPYTIGGDNGPPDSTLSDFVRSWNERYESPRLVIGTHQEMFEAFEREDSVGVKTVRGDFTPYWEDGVGSTANETALARRAVDRLVRAEAVWSFRTTQEFPDSLNRSAWRNVVLWDEHTWGAWNSISDPDASSVKAQWKYKRAFALNADRESRELLTSIAPSERSKVIDVVNTHNWTRTDVAFLDPEASKGFEGAHTADGKSVAAQRLRTGELVIRAEDVPSLSSKRYTLTKIGRKVSGAQASATTLENEFLTVKVSPRSGAITSLRRKRDGYEFVDPSREGVNALLNVRGRDPKEATRLRGVRVRVQESGGLVASLLITGTADGCRSYETELRLFAGIPRLDIINRIDKLPVREKEAIHFAFPFRISDPQPRYDVASSIVRPELDQLGGSCKNFFTAQSWFDVSNERVGVACALLDAPMFQLGGITVEQPWMRTLEPSSSIYSYAMNNYWHTNYKADQEGAVAFEYRIHPHEAFDPVATVRFAQDSREPMIVIPVKASEHRTELAFDIQSKASVLSVRPLSDRKATLVMLMNPTADARSVELVAREGKQMTAWRSDPGGAAGEKLGGRWMIGPHAVEYVTIGETPGILRSRE